MKLPHEDYEGRTWMQDPEQPLEEFSILGILREHGEV